MNYLFPSPRPTYRIVEIKDTFYTHRVEQRVRWLWFEWWVKVKDCMDLAGARTVTSRFEAFDFKQPEQRIVEQADYERNRGWVTLPDPAKVKTRAELLAIAKQLGARVQRDPARDAALTRSFHRMLSRLEPPPKPVDGVPWDPIRYPIEWPGWPRVRMDVRFLEDRP